MDNSTTKAKLSDFKSLVAFILCQHFKKLFFLLYYSSKEKASEKRKKEKKNT